MTVFEIYPGGTGGALYGCSPVGTGGTVGSGPTPRAARRQARAIVRRGARWWRQAIKERSRRGLAPQE